MDKKAILSQNQKAYKRCLSELDLEEDFEILKNDLKDTFQDLKWPKGFKIDNLHAFVAQKELHKYCAIKYSDPAQLQTK